MEELIKITYDNDRITVLARDLHEFLEIGTAFKDWFPRMCDYGFEEGIDFNPLKIEQVRKIDGIDYTPGHFCPPSKWAAA